MHLRVRDGAPHSARLEAFLLAVIDATLFAQNLVLAFESLGYGICYIGGLRNHIAEVDRLLGLPTGVYPLYGLCVGVAAEQPMARPRLPLEAVYFEGRYPDDETMLQLLWNRFIEQEIFQAAVQHLETALEKAGVSAPRERHPAAVAFLDLTGYTDLTERAGDEVAAERARRLVDLIRPAAARHGGRVVKTLGDGAMFHFQDPANAVRCGLTLVEAVPEVGLPLARFGVNAGPLIIKDADYYGRTVNIAARIVDYARPREVLASVDVVENSEGSDILFEEVGPVSLKGVPDPVVIYKAVAAPAL